MSKWLTTWLLLTVTPQIAIAQYVYEDDFNSGVLNTTVWNDGGGFFVNPTNVRLDSFGGNFGARGDLSGAAGLNSAQGQASFAVAPRSGVPLVGQFYVGNGTYANTDSAIAGISFGSGPYAGISGGSGAGKVEVLWNNTDSSAPFQTRSGWSGTIDPNTSLWSNDGGATFETFASDAQANISSGDFATSFGFWTTADGDALLDNFRISDQLSVPLAPPLPGSTVFADDFTGEEGVNTNPTVWNTGGGAFFSGATMNLNNFGANFASRGDNTGAAGLDSNTGFASFSVAEPGAEGAVLGFNFQIGNELFTNTNEAIVRINLANTGAGDYEIAWNNSFEDMTIELDGFSGNLASGQYVYTIDGFGPTFGFTDAAGGVSLGDSATRFGFWAGGVGGTDTRAVIDDFRINVPGVAGLSGDYNGDGTVDAADYTVWRDNLGATEDGSVLSGNGNGGTVDNTDYDLWKTNFGNSSVSGAGSSAVPEPSTGFIALALLWLSYLRASRVAIR